LWIFYQQAQYNFCILTVCEAFSEAGFDFAGTAEDFSVFPPKSALGEVEAVSFDRVFLRTGQLDPLVLKAKGLITERSSNQRHQKYKADHFQSKTN